MLFEEQYAKQVQEEVERHPFGPFNYVWCTDKIAHTFRYYLPCPCGLRSGFIYDDGCEIPVCSEQCVHTYLLLTTQLSTPHNTKSIEDSKE